LFAGVGAFAWLRGLAIEKLEGRPDEVAVREGDDPRVQAGDGSTGADADHGEAKTDESPPPPRIELVPTAAATTGADDDTDGISFVPSVPPEPEIESTTDGPPGTSLVPPPPPVDPVGVFRFGRYVALDKSLPPGPHRQAKNYCDRLRATGYLGIRGWALPNPAQSEKLVGLASVRKGKYWTSALHRGRALAVSLPSGAKTSISSERGRARGLCIARWP